MSNSEMVLVPRALLGAVASALETGNPAQKTLASVRELYLSDDFPDSKAMQEAGKYTSGADWAQEANGVDDLMTAVDGMADYVAADGSVVNAGTVKAFEHALFEGVTVVNITDNAEKFLLPRICSDIKVGDYLLKTQDGQLRHMARAAFLSTYKPVVQEIDLESADFSDALMWLKEGKRVCRSGWNGAGQFAWMVPPGSYPARMEAIKGHYPDDMVPYGAYFALKNAQDTVVPWVPSVGDLLATDWQVYEAPKQGRGS